LWFIVENSERTLSGRRILVAGNSGAGKTTVAATLAERLGLPTVDLDALFWLPAWQEPDPEEFRANVRAALAAEPDGWVVAGNYKGRLGDITWAAADTVIWLDLPLRVSLWRILKRSWRRWRSKELLWGTNYEKFWPQLKIWSPKDSLIAFSIKGHRQQRRTVEMLLARRGSEVRWFRLRSAAEVEAFVSGISSA
jgi:Shikimate kinase